MADESVAHPMDEDEAALRMRGDRFCCTGKDGKVLGPVRRSLPEAIAAFEALQ